MLGVVGYEYVTARECHPGNWQIDFVCWISGLSQGRERICSNQFRFLGQWNNFTMIGKV